MFRGTRFIICCCCSTIEDSFSILCFLLTSLRFSLNCSISPSFSVCASALNAAPSKETSEPGIGTVEYFSRIAHRNLGEYFFV